MSDSLKQIVGSDGSPETAKTIDEFIELNKTDDITYSNYSILNKIVNGSTILFPEHNLIYDYIKELKDHCILIELDSDQFITYRYNPKKLAYRLYGHSELYFIILALNNMCSFKDFNRRRIKMLYKRDLEDLMTQIYNAESDYISKNREKMKNN